MLSFSLEKGKLCKLVYLTYRVTVCDYHHFLNLKIRTELMDEVLKCIFEYLVMGQLKFGE